MTMTTEEAVAVLTALDEIEADEGSLEIRRRRQLEKCGWRYITGHGSLWLYEKTMSDGKVVQVNESQAETISRSELYAIAPEYEG